MGKKSDPRKEDKLRRVLQSAQLRAASRVRGLFLKPSDPGYNPDADVPWKEATTATRAAIALANGAIATERARLGTQTTNNFFGAVAVMPRIDGARDWETFHKAVSDGDVVIDVPALPAEEPAKDE